MYKTGQLHEDADCLSRHPVDPPDLPETGESTCVLMLTVFGDIANEQRPDLTDLTSSPSLRMFVLQDDKLYHYNMRPDCPELPAAGRSQAYA